MFEVVVTFLEGSTLSPEVKKASDGLVIGSAATAVTSAKRALAWADKYTKSIWVEPGCYYKADIQLRLNGKVLFGDRWYLQSPQDNLPWSEDGNIGKGSARALLEESKQEDSRKDNQNVV